MRLLVCGGREYSDRGHVFAQLDRALAEHPDMVICCGYNPRDERFQGADELAYEWAKARGVHGSVFPAHWRREGRPAGPKRNRRMLRIFKPDAVLAFPGGAGTADMCNAARQSGVVVRASPSHPHPLQEQQPPLSALSGASPR